MKNTETILDEVKDSFLWEDKKTIDVIISDESKTFIEMLADYKCLKCDNNIVMGNQHLCRGMDENVKGIEITCKSCDQKWFIHEQFTSI